VATLSHDDLMTLWRLEGGLQQDADTAAAIAQAESGGRTGAINNTAYPNKPGYHLPAPGNLPEYSVGLWQINMLAHPQYTEASLLTANGNAKAAVQIAGLPARWTPWSTYTNGAYKQFLQAPSGPFPGPEAGGDVAVGAVAASGHRGYADLRNSLARHLPRQLERSRQTGLVTLQLLSRKRKVGG
jgi:hypothetical protein